MEMPKSNAQEKVNPCPQTNSNHSNSSSSSSSSGVPITPPKTTPRSETNIYPTTFIQADTSSFKQVVQMLTGSSETTPKQASRSTDPSRISIPPIKTGPKKPSFKLYERRNCLKNLNISPFLPTTNFGGGGSAFSLHKPEILSPSMLDFPSLVLSPVTPLNLEPFNRPPPPPTLPPGDCGVLAEDKAIAENGFCLHPSPITTPRDAEPRLLPLFPETSPRLSGSSS